MRGFDCREENVSSEVGSLLWVYDTARDKTLYLVKVVVVKGAKQLWIAPNLRQLLCADSMITRRVRFQSAGPYGLCAKESSSRFHSHIGNVAETESVTDDLRQCLPQAIPKTARSGIAAP